MKTIKHYEDGIKHAQKKVEEMDEYIEKTKGTKNGMMDLLISLRTDYKEHIEYYKSKIEKLKNEAL